MTASLEVERRREALASLLVRTRRPTVRRLADALNASQRFGTVSKSTVHRDLQAVRGTFRDVLAEKADDLYVRAVADIEEIRGEFWRLYRQSGLPPCRTCGRGPEPGTGLNLLNSLLGLHSRRVKLGQTLGLVVKEPERAVLELEAGAAARALLDALARYRDPDAADKVVKALDAIGKEQPELVASLLVR